MYMRYQPLRRALLRDPGAASYTGTALSPVTDDELDELEIFQVSEGARSAARKAQKRSSSPGALGARLAPLTPLSPPEKASGTEDATRREVPLLTA